MTFREFLDWLEQEVRGIKNFDPGLQIPSAIPKMVEKGGAKNMRMTAVVSPAKPIFRKAGSGQAKSGIAGNG